MIFRVLPAALGDAMAAASWYDDQRIGLGDEFLDEVQDAWAATGKPVVLTINGKAEVAVQKEAAYQRIIEQPARADREETIAAIKEGLADVKAGRTKPARTALRALAKEYGIPTGDA